MPVFLINLIIGIILSAASTLLQQAFAPKPEEQRRRTGTRGATQFGGKVPQYFLVGTVGEPGKAEYRNAWGSSRSEEHTSELQSRPHLVCRLLLEKKKKKKTQ